MILGLNFNDELDLTAIGTLLLAAATFLSLLVVLRSLKQNQAQIKLGQQQLAQTQEEIGFSRKEACFTRAEAEAAHRPVVVPVAGGQHVTLAGGEELPAGPHLPEPGLLVVPIMNIGLGPALSLESTIEALEPAEAASEAWSEQQPLGEVTGICVSEVISLETAIDELGEVPSFKLTLTYHDVVGREWRTVAGWISDRRRYEGMAIRSSWPNTNDPHLKTRRPFQRSAEREREFADLGLLPATRP